jgi:hypothetical protein
MRHVWLPLLTTLVIRALTHFAEATSLEEAARLRQRIDEIDAEVTVETTLYEEELTRGIAAGWVDRRECQCLT